MLVSGVQQSESVIRKVKVAQSCPTLCDPMHYPVHGILQARILEWAAFPFSRGSSQPRDGTQVSRIAGGFFPIWAPSYTYTCISLYAFLDPFPLYVIGEYSLEFPVPPRRSLLSSVWHTAVCTRQSQSPGFPSPTLPLVNPSFVFYVRVSISVVSSQINAGAFLMKWHGDLSLGFLFVCFYYNRDE